MEMSTIYKGIAKATNWVGKNAPAILTGTGVLGVGWAAVEVYKAAPKVEKIVSDMEEDIENGEPVDRVAVVRDISAAMALPVVIGTVSIGAIITSWKIQNDRITVLGSALTALSAEYKHYRDKYVEVHGEEEAREFNNVVKKEVEYVNKKGEKKTKKVAQAEKYTDNTGVWYSRSDDYVADDSEYNEFAVIQGIRELEALVLKKGIITVNDVYHMFNMPETRRGALLGWTDSTFSIDYDKKFAFWDEEHQMEAPDIRLNWAMPDYIYK